MRSVKPKSSYITNHNGMGNHYIIIISYKKIYLHLEL